MLCRCVENLATSKTGAITLTILGYTWEQLHDVCFDNWMQPKMSLVQMVRELSGQKFMAAKETCAAQRIQEQRICPNWCQIVVSKGVFRITNT